MKILLEIKKHILKNNLFLFIYNKFMKRKRKIYFKCVEFFNQKNGIEIGGPSMIFSIGNPLPFYTIVKSLDNINFSSHNFWSNLEEGNTFIFDKNKRPGKQIIADAVDLSKIQEETYDFILSSHVLEHVANPIKALYEWKRILKKNGKLFLIVPNRKYTYDRCRPLTTLEHIINDYYCNVDESDSTHLDEIIRLHDLDIDTTVKNYDEHVARTLNNSKTRIAHHHTFDMNLIAELISFCGFKCIFKEEFRPYHLTIVAEK